MDRNRAIGRHTAAEIRNDEEGLLAISSVTGQPVDWIRTRLGATHGATQVRNAFNEFWPWTASGLGQRTVTFVRDFGLRDEIRWVTKASQLLISKRLNSAHGKQLVRNLFWDWWPALDTQVAPPPPDGNVDVAEPISATSESPPSTPGTLLSNRYELKQRLGQGGVGTTWAAHDRLTGLDLVVKIPHSSDGGAIRNELRQAFRILHPNICQAFPDRDDDTGQPFLVMQHGGVDLVQRMSEPGHSPFPLVLAVHVLVSIADALDYLHQNSVLHLDVTPKNILIDADDAVRLADFGASSEARTYVGQDGHRTQLATSLHSFNHCYAAPELFDRVARSRSDQYGLFLVFCSLLEGGVRTKPPAYHDFRPFSALSDAQNKVIHRALSWDPDERFETCGEAARLLADDMSHVPQRVLAGDIERLVADFVRRVDLEHQRRSAGTTLLGGALKLGRSIERLLQAGLVWLASANAFEPLEALRVFDPHATDIDRTTAGNLAKTIVARSEPGTSPDSPVGLLAVDLRERKSSRLWGLINARNDVIHGRRPPEAILPYAAAVADMLRAPFPVISQ